MVTIGVLVEVGTCKEQCARHEEMHTIFTSSNFGLLDRGDITIGYLALLGAYTKLRKAIISFVMSVRPSVCPRGTSGLPLDGLSRNLIFECFSKICQQN